MISVSEEEACKFESMGKIHFYLILHSVSVNKEQFVEGSILKNYFYLQMLSPVTLVKPIILKNELYQFLSQLCMSRIKMVIDMW